MRSVVSGCSAAPARQNPLFVLATAGAVLLALSSAGAHGATFGRIEAISTGGELPAEAIAILPDENELEYVHDPLYRAARKAVANALQEKGLRVSKAGPLTLRISIDRPLFETDDRAQSQAPIQPEPPEVPEVIDQVEIPLQAPNPDVQASLSLGLLLSDETGKPLWSANASVAGETAERESVVRRLGAAAVSDMGSSVKRSFLLDCRRTADGDSNLCLD